MINTVVDDINGVAHITLSNFLCKQANPEAIYIGRHTYTKICLYVHRSMNEFDLDMVSCVKDRALTFWCCTEKMTKTAQPGDFVYSSHVTHGVCMLSLV